MPKYLVTAKYADPGMERIAEWIAAMLEACAPSAEKIGGITPKILVAQAGLETGWGRQCFDHNLFNIKADNGWRGAVITGPTREVIGGQDVFLDQPFRQYDSFADSIADHLKFLWDNKRYEAAGVFSAKSDDEFAWALQRGEYATDPHYAQSLISVEGTIEAFMAHMSISTDPALQPVAVIPPPPHVQGIVPGAFHILMAGTHGDDVKSMQAKLGFAGADLDGWFGSKTYAAVRTFQLQHSLDVDGVVGQKTATALGLQ